nr:hypothetical protein 31 [Paracoccaceae bacterium]
MASALKNTMNKSMTQTTLLFDLESTGLLRQGSQLHCIVARNADTGETLVWDKVKDNLDIGVEQLRTADVLVGHNIASYDIPLIQELYDFNPQGQIIDTLVLSRLFYPHISDRDFERRPIGMPQRLYGRHSLEAWGHRLKCFKGDFGKHEGAWDKYTPEMLDYCIQDTEVTLKLYELMLRRCNDYA